MSYSLIEIGSKTAEKNCTNKQTNRHYENNGHLAVNQLEHSFIAGFCVKKTANAIAKRNAKVTVSDNNITIALF